MGVCSRLIGLHHPVPAPRGSGSPIPLFPRDRNPMAAIQLSRYCQFAVAGGDPAEPGSGEKIATRLALSATEFHQQPIAQGFSESLAEARDSISGLIEETLSSTFTLDDLDAISDQLKRATSPRVD